MQKQKPIDISTTNIALLGSDLEKKARLNASDKEPAWNTAGKQPGLEIWRVEKFKIIAWPKDQYGTFFNGDSYIVLNTIKGADGKFSYDVHFWLGQYTSQDEAGTAAYKTVELDDHLGTLPVQHREVQGSETELFLSYFGNAIRTIAGGVDSGFRHWDEPEYRAQLLHCFGENMRSIKFEEVPLAVSSLNGGDVYILDLGKTIWQWNGKTSSAYEKNRAAEYVRKMQADRKFAPIKVVEQGDHEEGQFLAAIGTGAGQPANQQAQKEIAARAVATQSDPVWKSRGRGLPAAPAGKKLYSLSDATGRLVLKEIAQGKAMQKSMLHTDDAFIIDAGDEVFVWIGKKASVKERKFALQYAENYLHEHKRPPTLPISRVIEGSESAHFWHAFA
jgi:gelsolin